ncbi:MAG: DUF5719 family protein [Actinomycetes bacterium]
MSDDTTPAFDAQDLPTTSAKLPFDDDELRTTKADFSTPEVVSSQVDDSANTQTVSKESGSPSRVVRVRSGNATSAADRPKRPAREPRISEPLTMRSRRGVALIALGSLVFLAVVGTVANRGTSETPAVPTVEPVASSELVCPVTTATDELASAITAAVAPLSTVTTGTASLANLVKVGGKTDPLVIASPGELVQRVFRGKSGPAQMAGAIGSYATGFGADQVIRSGIGSSRGLAIAPCSRSVTDTWLIGGGATIGRLTTILLANNDDRPAQVDLVIYGPDGLVNSPGASGIAVPAASTLRLQLSDLAPSQSVTAVHVIATAGRVATSALEFDSRGLVPQGVSIMSPTAAGRSLVIPMVPKAVAAARLVLIAPSSDATAHVNLLTAQGSITPVGFDAVELTAGRVTTLDLTTVLAGAAGGLVIKADRDVVAGVIITTGVKDQLREGDREAATPALVSPGLIAGLAGPNVIHELGISAPTAQAIVKLELFVTGAPAATWTKTVTVKAGSLADVRIPVTTAKATSIVVVTPVSGGPIYVTRSVTELGGNGPLLGLAPLLSTRATTLVPPVEGAPGSAVLGSQ